MMDMSEEFTNNLKSLQYYSKRIRDAVNEQFDIYFDKYNIHGEEGDLMVNVLRAIFWGATEVDSWCIVIQKNIDKGNSIKLPRLKEEVGT